MTIRHISTATATTTDAVVKVWKKQPFGPHPGLDTPLPKEQAEHLLTVMAQPTTRRTPEAAQAAATCRVPGGYAPKRTRRGSHAAYSNATGTT